MNKGRDKMHTKGPWGWVIHDYSQATLHGPDEMFDHVLSISPCDSCLEHAKTKGEAAWKWGRCTTPTLADARLLAEAPNMLRALETIMEDTESLEIREIASYAIRQAKEK
jgi:hypothetical protein